MSLKWALIGSTLFLAIWGITLVLPERIYAQDSQDPNAGLVAVGGEEVLRFRTAPAGMTLQQRANAIQERLVTILSDTTLRPSDIVTAPAKGDYKILVKNRLLVTVTRKDANANKTSPKLLADTWARHVRKVLPQVNVRPNPNNGEPKSNP
jgi:ABC-type phosphate transport system auxiliary subunit